MNNLDGMNFLKDILNEDLSIDSQVSALFDILENVLDRGAVRARTVKYKLQKYVSSTNICERVYALNMIASDGKGIQSVPSVEELNEVLESTVGHIVDCIAKRYVQGQVEAKVEKAIIEKQEKYVDEVRLSIIKKQKGLSLIHI